MHGPRSSTVPLSRSVHPDPYVPNRLAPPSLLRSLATVPSSALASAGDGVGVLPAVGSPGSGANLVRLVPPAPLKEGGKPLVAFVATEYCPYCAAARWPLTVALERFGTFSGLETTASSPLEPYSDTATLSYVHATYSSRYLSFSGAELSSNVCPRRDVVVNDQRDSALPSWKSPRYVCSGVAFRSLEQPTTEVEDAMSDVDSVPNFTDKLAETIPFVDFGGLYAEAGTLDGPALLHGESVAQVLALFRRPSSPAGRVLLATANRYTAILCELTDGLPGSVCHSGVIEKAKAALAR